MCESKQILVYSKIVLLKVSVWVQSTFKSFLRYPTIIVLKNIHQKCNILIKHLSIFKKYFAIYWIENKFYKNQKIKKRQYLSVVMHAIWKNLGFYIIRCLCLKAVMFLNLKSLTLRTVKSFGRTRVVEDQFQIEAPDPYPPNKQHASSPVRSSSVTYIHLKLPN